MYVHVVEPSPTTLIVAVLPLVDDLFPLLSTHVTAQS